ncbi:(2Fe-2S)-binding protein [Sporosarcina ureilytica]|uniref:(2Fe-2S)-binding protein n=1 Tax=Sporosarcina ureilytica TaxID=298596 RepID=UPI00094C6765|nr:(2Fe-2S)-binding protein [Sporosarcina ureilytica]
MEKTIICRCEDVSLEDIETTANTYNCSAREVKLRTRAGMGYCGGRTCRPAVDAVLEHVTGEKAGHTIPLKVQPPVRPVTLSVLGGNRNDD